MTRGSRRSIALVTERLLYPPYNGYSRRIMELIRSFQEVGLHVILVSRRLDGLRTRWRTRALVNELITVPAGRFPGGRLDAYDCSPFFPAIEEVARRHSPLAFIAECSWMAPCLTAVPPGILRVVDTLDLMYVRSDMYGGIEGGAWVECTREEEARTIRHADIILAIQDEERAEFAAMVPDRTVLQVPHPAPVVSVRGRQRAGEIAFIGSGNHANVRGLESFLGDVWPDLVERAPAARLRVYGRVADRVTGGVEGVTLVGPVRSLRGAYARASVVINPIRLGTGLKIKSLEALAHGRALVTTSSGGAGLEAGWGTALLVEDEKERFAAAVARLLTEQRERTQLEREARRFVTERFSRRAAIAPLLAVLEDPAAVRAAG